MASNFRITAHRNGENLHLKLKGDFDGSSACQLLNFLKKSSNGASRVVIHTKCLKDVYPFGRDIFLRKLNDFNGNGRRPQLLFMGENASQIAPEKDLCP
jgi:hypothetical protein